MRKRSKLRRAKYMLAGHQQSYLLRIWPVRVSGRQVWRASLVSIPDGSSRRFASLAELCAFLDSQAAGPLDAPEEAA